MLSGILILPRPTSDVAANTTRDRGSDSSTGCASVVQLASAGTGQPITEGSRVVMIGGPPALRGQQGRVTQLIGDDALVMFEGAPARIVPAGDLRLVAGKDKQNRKKF